MDFHPAMKTKVKPEYQRDPRLAMQNLSFYTTQKSLKKSYVLSDTSGMYLSGLSGGELSICDFNGSNTKNIKTSFKRQIKGSTEIPLNALGSAYVRFNAR